MTSQIHALEGEEWRVIPGYPDYQISNLGRVFSNRTSKPKLIGATNRKYAAVGICNDAGEYATVAVHRLVAWTFLGPQKAGMYVAHNNGDSRDNRLCNLRYATPKENAADARAHGVLKLKFVPPNVIESRMVFVRRVDALVESGTPKMRAIRAVGITPGNYQQWKRNWQKKNFTGLKSIGISTFSKKTGVI